jgi:hypothetical protein
LLRCFYESLRLFYAELSFELFYESLRLFYAELSFELFHESLRLFYAQLSFHRNLHIFFLDDRSI